MAMPVPPEPKVVYIQGITIQDIDPDTLHEFETWDQAEGFAQDLQQSDSINRWLMGLYAGKLPKEDPKHTFESWCNDAGFSPGRVAVWRRMTEVFDFKKEVQKFPRLSHKHFEVLLGRMAKAKASKDGQLYETIMAALEQAENQSHSSKRMLAELLNGEGKSKALTELAFKIQGGMGFKKLNMAEPGAPAEYRQCLVLVPSSETEGAQWEQQASDHGVIHELVTAVFERVDTE